MEKTVCAEEGVEVAQTRCEIACDLEKQLGGE